MCHGKGLGLLTARSWVRNPKPLHATWQAATWLALLPSVRLPRG